MARIPEDELERLKAEVSLVGAGGGCRGRAAPGGADLVGCCPFHDDREPSLVVSPAKKLVALHGGLPVGWQRGRLGDEGRGGQLSSRGGAAA